MWSGGLTVPAWARLSSSSHRRTTARVHHLHTKGPLRRRRLWARRQDQAPHPAPIRDPRGAAGHRPPARPVPPGSPPRPAPPPSSEPPPSPPQVLLLHAARPSRARGARSAGEGRGPRASRPGQGACADPRAAAAEEAALAGARTPHTPAEAAQAQWARPPTALSALCARRSDAGSPLAHAPPRRRSGCARGPALSLASRGSACQARGRTRRVPQHLFVCAAPPPFPGASVVRRWTNRRNRRALWS